MNAAQAVAMAAILIIAAIWGCYHLAQLPERQPFPDPADTADPDGAAWLAALHHDGPLPAAGLLPMLPPDPPPADTGPIPHAVGTWGMTRDQLLDQMARDYLEVTK